MKTFILLSALFCSFKTSFAQPGELDPSFGTNGIVTSDFGVETYYTSIAVQSDGKTVAAGYIFNGHPAMIVARYNIDGSLDKSFSDDGKQISDYFHSANSVIIQHDGKIVVAGPLGIARYNSNGSPDHTFSDDGMHEFDFGISSLAIQSDGKIVGVYFSGVVRFNSNGSPDNTFSEDGKQTTDFENTDIAIQSDGKIVLAGTTYSDETGSDFGIARYNQDGSPDYSFSSDGKQTTDFGYLETVSSIAIQDDEKIVVGGNININAEEYDFCIARYNTDGSPDNSFSDDGKQTADFSSSDFSINNSVVIQSDGKIVMGGNSQIFDNRSGFSLIRYNTNGSVDLTFSKDGKQTTDVSEGSNLLYSIIIADNKLYAIGFGEFPNHRGIVAKYLLDGENKAPAVTLAIPYNIIKYGSPARIKIDANATDEDGAITKVRFYSSTTFLHTETVSPYGFLWENVPAGTYTLTAIAFDNDGNRTTSNSIEVSVVEENVPPVVSIVSPADDTTYSSPAIVHLIASAKDPNDRISKVEFFNGTTLLRTEYYYPYTYWWENIQPGTYIITAKAKDDKGLSATSDPVTITVTAPVESLVSSRSSSVSSKTNLNGTLNVKLSPNPASNILQIFTNGLQRNKQSTISVISASGVVMKPMRLNSSNQLVPLNVSSFASGVYTIKVICGDKVMHKQFVKL